MCPGLGNIVVKYAKQEQEPLLMGLHNLPGDCHSWQPITHLKINNINRNTYPMEVFETLDHLRPKFTKNLADSQEPMHRNETKISVQVGQS